MSEREEPAGSATLVTATALSLAFTFSALLNLPPWLRGPAPYPPEWQWEYRAPLEPIPLGAILLIAAVLLLLAVSGLPALQRRARAGARGLVPAAVVLGFLLPLALLAREPGGALRTLLARTSSFSTTSYLTVALRDEARDPLDFVRRHAGLLPELARTAKHAATHPVGPVLLFRAAVVACERSPALTNALLDAAGVPRRAFAPPLTRGARGGALLGALVLGLLAAATAWPLASLAEELGATPLAAGRTALLWCLLPGPALFAPRFDAALALPVVAYAALIARAARGPHRVPRALAAGACAAAALLLSYGAAAFLALAGLAVAVSLVARADAAGPQPQTPATGAAVALLVSTGAAAAISFGLPWLAGGHPVEAMRTALAIHHEAYTAPRSYSLWLLFDPIDFAALTGVAVVCLAGAAALAAARALRRRQPAPAAAVLEIAVLTGVVLLDASGVARGEVGRLWIPLMPLVLLAGGSAFEGARARPSLLAGLLCAGSTLALAAAWRL